MAPKMKTDISNPGYDGAYYLDVVRKAKILACNQFPYFTTPLLAMKVTISPRAVGFNNSPTFAVDKYMRCTAHPAALEKWINQAKAVSTAKPCPTCKKTSHSPFAYIAGVLIHEMLHPFRHHFDRAEKMGLKKIETIEDMIKAARLNIAMDMELNDSLLEACKLTNTDKVCLPDGLYYPAKFNFPDNEFWEHYYKLLEQMGKDDPSNDQAQAGMCGSGADGIPREFDEGGDGGEDFTGVNEAEREAMQRKVANDTKEHAAKNPGTVPGGWSRWADMIIAPPKYDWKKDLNRKIRYSVQRLIPGSKVTTYAKRSVITTVLGSNPNRPSAVGVPVLPTYKKPVPNICIIADTSGSMDAVAGMAAYAEIEGIMKTIKGKVRLIACDAAAHEVGEFKSMKGISLPGGGGTILAEGIRMALKGKRGKKPNCIILMTDGYDSFTVSQSECKDTQVIVALVGNHTTAEAIPSFMHIVKVPV